MKSGHWINALTMCKIYFSATPRWAVNSLDQEVSVENYRSSDIHILKTGTLEQNVLGKSGDIICIDWGYFYLAGNLSESSDMSVGTPRSIQESFAGKGILPDTKISRTSVRLDKEEILFSVWRKSGQCERTEIRRIFDDRL